MVTGAGEDTVIQKGGGVGRKKGGWGFYEKEGVLRVTFLAMFFSEGLRKALNKRLLNLCFREFVFWYILFCIHRLRILLLSRL